MRWGLVLLAIAGCDRVLGLESVRLDDSRGVVGEILFVQNASAQCMAVPSCSTMMLASRSPAGDTLLFTVSYDDVLNQVSGVTDDAGNTYSPVIAPTTWAKHGFRTEAWYAISNGGGNPITVTATFSVPTTSFALVYLDEYSGASFSTPIDQHSVMTGLGPVTAISSGAATTVTPRELIFGHGEAQFGSVGVGSGFIMRNTAGGNVEEDRFVMSADSYDASFTGTNGDAWLALMITLQ